MLPLYGISLIVHSLIIFAFKAKKFLKPYVIKLRYEIKRDIRYISHFNTNLFHIINTSKEFNFSLLLPDIKSLAIVSL